MTRRAIHLIVNPVAGRGRPLRMLRRAIDAFRAIGDVSESMSAHAGDEATIAETAARTGADAIVVIGGDGSFSHVARGVVRSGVRVPIAIVAAGTGNDFAKSLGAPVHDIDATASLVASNSTRNIDACEADGHMFVNSAGFGFDAEVLAQMASNGAGGGATRYAATALRHLFGYGGFRASLRIPPHANTEVSNQDTGADDNWLTMVFANGRWFGGVFQIAPDARIDDGLIDCIGVRDASSFQRVSLFVRALRGRHVSSPAVVMRRRHEFLLQFPDPPRFQVDGELVQATSALVRICVIPDAISVFADSGQ